MKRTPFSSLLVVTFILVASLIFTGCQNSSSSFTMTKDATKVQNLDNNQVMYQTSLSAEGVLAFYREELGASLNEREILTVVTGSSLNLVFDGSENGQALVIQATKLDEDTTNVVVRYEEI